MKMSGPLQFARALAERFGQRYALPLRAGNSVSLLEGGAWMQATETLIRGARNSLRFEMYLWADDEVGRRVAKMLQEALDRGVIVHGIVDAVGSSGSGGMLEALRSSGADLKVFHPVSLRSPFRKWNRRNHRKLLIADEDSALLGSANWGKDYDASVNSEAFLDLGIVLTGPSVADLVTDFQRLWQRMKGVPLPKEGSSQGCCWRGPWLSPVDVQVVTSLSLLGNRAIRRHLLVFLRQARKTIWIANAYFVPKFHNAASRTSLTHFAFMANQSVAF
jgi:cardiolipin synthase